MPAATNREWKLVATTPVDHRTNPIWGFAHGTKPRCQLGASVKGRFVLAEHSLARTEQHCIVRRNIGKWWKLRPCAARQKNCRCEQSGGLDGSEDLAAGKVAHVKSALFSRNRHRRFTNPSHFFCCDRRPNRRPTGTMSQPWVTVKGLFVRSLKSHFRVRQNVQCTCFSPARQELIRKEA